VYDQKIIFVRNGLFCVCVCVRACVRSLDGARSGDRLHAPPRNRYLRNLPYIQLRLSLPDVSPRIVRLLIKFLA
jgi:hypothetical protein